MASSWRQNRELWGWGGYVMNGPLQPFSEGPIDYLAELNPPVPRGWGTATHLAFGPRFVGLRRAFFGVLLNDNFICHEQFTMVPGFHFPGPWPVLPD